MLAIFWPFSADLVFDHLVPWHTHWKLAWNMELRCSFSLVVRQLLVRVTRWMKLYIPHHRYSPGGWLERFTTTSMSTLHLSVSIIHTAVPCCWSAPQYGWYFSTLLFCPATSSRSQRSPWYDHDRTLIMCSYAPLSMSLFLSHVLWLIPSKSWLSLSCLHIKGWIWRRTNAAPSPNFQKLPTIRKPAHADLDRERSGLDNFKHYHVVHLLCSSDFDCCRFYIPVGYFHWRGMVVHVVMKIWRLL